MDRRCDLGGRKGRAPVHRGASGAGVSTAGVPTNRSNAPGEQLARKPHGLMWLLALQSGDRALHPDFYPGAEPIGPISAPGFAAVSKSCLSDYLLTLLASQPVLHCRHYY